MNQLFYAYEKWRFFYGIKILLVCIAIVVLWLLLFRPLIQRIIDRYNEKKFIEKIVRENK